MGKVLRTEHRFFARQQERVHLKLKWELYERVLNKILVKAVATAFELDELSEWTADQRFENWRRSFLTDQIRETY